eukprot:TRINITY_DN16094_c0_g1_i4.p3 TRINITY_DN16094_c0_g1~~TRINITY_DN16094_c0_g1_i4.p3  ORF type:complete len:109 (+),score=14.39 TRINITY_DN16094_c0_g1_i4:671-997(+)
MMMPVLQTVWSARVDKRSVWGDANAHAHVHNVYISSSPPDRERELSHCFLPQTTSTPRKLLMNVNCLLYTSDAADEEDSVDLGGRRIIKKKKKKKLNRKTRRTWHENI